MTSSERNCPAEPTLNELGEFLENCQTIALASHTRPDGDAIGSLLGLGQALMQIGKDVVMLNQDGATARYMFLDGADQIKVPADIQKKLQVDAFVALDTADAKRVGARVRDVIESYGTQIVIDHHVSNERYGDINYVDADSPATGQIVYELIQARGWPLTDGARDALWAAIVTDTGSFQYSNTTERTFEIGGDLVRRGVNVGDLSARIYQSYRRERLELLKELLNTMEFSCGGKVASWKIRREVIERLQIEPTDQEGLIDYLRAVNGVIVAVSFEEGPDLVRISARSKSPEVNVSAICEQFGGGGHVLAAGAASQGKIDEVAERFLQVVAKVIEDNG